MQFINKEPTPNKWASALGNSLNDLLTGLTEKKTEEMNHKRQLKRQQEQRKHYGDIFQQAGYDPQTSQMLTALSEINPKAFGDILRSLGTGLEQPQQNKNPMDQFHPEVDKTSHLLPQQQIFGQKQDYQDAQDQASQVFPKQQQAQSLTPNFAQQLAKRSQQEKPKSVAEQKHEDELVAHKDRLVDTIQTARRMQEAIDKGATYGLLATGTAAANPSWLDPLTEQLDKDSSHLINLTSGEIKGVPSKYRVALIEKEKPGVKHSPNVNRQILNRTIKSAEDKLKELQKSYPFVNISQEELQPGEQLSQFQSKKHKGYDAYEENGKYFLWDKSKNDYVQAKLKGK